MKCLNCGAEIDATSKFCGYCGSPVEQSIPPENLSIQTDEQVPSDFNNNFMQQPETVNPVESEVNMEQSTVVSGIGSEINNPVDGSVQQTENSVASLFDIQPQQPEPTPTQPEPTPTQPVQPTNVPGKEKKSNTLVFIICGIVLAVVAAVLLILAFNKKSNGSIDALEKAINNTISSGANSGTITASIMVESSGTSMNFSGMVKYQKINDLYNLQLTLDKSMIYDQIDLYAAIDKKNATLYAKTSLIDMIAGTSSSSDSWGYYNVDLTEITSELENNVKTDNKIELTNLGIDKKIKYVGKSDGSSHYVFTIDRELFNILQSKMNSDEIQETNQILDSVSGTSELIDKGYNVDLYVRNDKLEKITIDLTKVIEDDSISKAIFTVEFKDFNNTIVNIPSEAKTGINLETYIGTNNNTYSGIDYGTTDLTTTDSFDLSL